jgi:L-alanine-DL-glutamate epimerase-like enolase superfamily enzyme
MKIREIRAIPVVVPRFEQTVIAASYGSTPAARHVVTIVTTDEGVIGVGEASPEYLWTGEDLRSCCNCITNYVAPALVGQDPLAVEAAARGMDAAITFNQQAKASVEMALWDIVGKVAKLPLHQVWGGRVRDAIAVKFVVSGPPQRAAEMARELTGRGFPYIKIKTGLELAGDLERVRAVRKALDQSVPIGIDSNEGWTYLETVKALPELEALGVSFIEQPFYRYPRQAFADLRKLTNIPLVAHESLFSVDDALELATTRAVDVWALTPQTHKGYLRTRDILGIANAARIPCLLGTNLELGIGSAFMAQIGLSAPSIDGTIPSDLIGPFYHVHDVINEKFELRGGAIHPPEGPGLGVTLDEDAMKRYRLDDK